jgi:O-antigen/teichoic acid export membrane protein
VAYRAGIGLFSALLAVRLLGVDIYGNIVTLLSLFVLYLGLVSSVFIVLVAKLMAPDNGAGTPDRSILVVAANAIALLSMAGIFCLAALLRGFAPDVQGLEAANRSFWAYAQSGSLILGALTCMQILSAMNSAIIESAGRLDLAMKWQMTGPSVVFLGLVALLLMESGVHGTTYLLLLCAGALADMMALWIVRRRLVDEHLILVHLRAALERIPGLLKSGSAIQFASFMNVFLEPLNKLALNHFSGGVAVTSYDLAMKVIWGIQGLFGAVMRVFLHLSGHGAEFIARTYVSVVSRLAVPALAVHTLGALLLSLAIHYWVDVSQDEIMVFYGIATISNLAMIYVTPLYVSLIAKDDRRFLFQNQLRLTVSNVVGSLLLIPLLGLIGSAIGLLCAAIYNSFAIFSRFGRVVGPAGGLRQALMGRQWSYLFATALFMASLLVGGTHELNRLVLAAIAGMLFLLVVKEPVTAELVRRMAFGQAGKP